MQKVVDIKFKKAGRSFTFQTNDFDLKLNDKVVVETSRGIEVGEVCKGAYELDKNEATAKVIRIASKEDLEKTEKQAKKKDEVWDIASKLVEKYKLEMKIVDVEFTLDNTKTIISFVCDDRVDFRELVKDLANSLKQRVELRQIGIRDQAKIVGGIGVCGKECCCKQYLNDFDKVSIKMAKMQGLSLNPTKISGVCGRLMCCLAYENDNYINVLKKMPRINSKVKTPDGEGIAIYNNLLKETITVKFDNDGDIKTADFKIEDVKFDKSAVSNIDKDEK